MSIKKKIYKIGENAYLAVGYLFKNPEVLTTKNGNKLTKFTLVIGKDDSQMQGKQSIFANCEAWRSMADTSANLQKNDTVMIIGSIHTNEYQGKTYNTLVVDFLVPTFDRGFDVVDTTTPSTLPDGKESKSSFDATEYEDVGSDTDLPF